MKRLLLLILFAVGCSSNETTPKRDLGSTEDTSTVKDMGTKADQASHDDLGKDLGAQSNCIQLKLDKEFKFAFEDDVSIQIESRLNKKIADRYSPFAILFERYGIEKDIGEFDLGSGQDHNFGGCAHCVFVKGSTSERVLFADKGKLINHVDPYQRTMNIEVKGLRLIEATVDSATRETTPIKGGICVEVEDFQVDKKFIPSFWLCDKAKYADGKFCDCTCGSYDPDCSTNQNCKPNDQACMKDPLPVRDCGEKMCGFDPITSKPKCIDSCDWEKKEKCDKGVCVFDHAGLGNECIDSAQRLAPDVVFGGKCPINNFQVVCNVVEGVALGYCGAENICRPLCEKMEECTKADESCRFFTGDEGLGFCAPEPKDG